MAELTPIPIIAEAPVAVHVGAFVKLCPKVTTHDVGVPAVTSTVNELFVAAALVPGPEIDAVPQVPIVGAVPPNNGIPFTVTRLPVAPVAPVDPVAPVPPVAPVAPVGPVAPTGPVGPKGPGFLALAWDTCIVTVAPVPLE